MSDHQTAAAAATEEFSGTTLLDQAIAATRQTEPDRAELLLRTLTEEALAGTVTYSRNLTVTINQAIAALDAKLSKQLAAVMHHPEFVALEGSWRGLHHLVMNSETSSNLKVRVLNSSKKDISRDLTKATEFDQSLTFKSVYENEFGTPGGEPYGALIGNFEFTQSYEDIELLRGLASVAAAGFCPLISSASPKLFGFKDFSELSRPPRPREDLRHHRIRELAVVPRQRRLSLRHPDPAARARPPALRQGNPADRRVPV